MRSRVELYKAFKEKITMLNPDCTITFSVTRDMKLTLVATAIVVWRTVVIEYTLFENGAVFLNHMRSTNHFEKATWNV